MTKTANKTIATAYILSTGKAVFLDENFQWTNNINDAFIADDEKGHELLEYHILKASKSALIVDGYKIGVERMNGTLSPLKMREKFRLMGGPSVAYIPIKNNDLKVA